MLLLGRYARHAVAVLAVFVATMIACSNDEAETVAGPGTTTAATTGTGGAATTTTTSGAGAGSNVVCNHDGRCNRGADAEHCACPDCWHFKSDCNAPPSSGCSDDGVCTTKEPCYCADCATEPECDGYCISCRAFTNFFSTPDALCTDGSPSSADLWADLKTKACTGVCLTECGVTLCTDSAPSMACLECIDQEFPAERDACMTDVRPHVYCNPLVAQPCSLGNAVCDVYRLGTNLVIDGPDLVTGFECYLRTTNASLCAACDYATGTDYCPKNLTCVDSTSEAVDVGECGKLCCDDADCGTGGACVKGGFDAVSTGLGVCDMSPSGGGGTGGTSSPGCETSATPSMGACVTVAIP